MLNMILPTSVIQLNIFETCAFFFSITRMSHSNAWPGTASSIIIIKLMVMIIGMSFNPELHDYV